MSNNNNEQLRTALGAQVGQYENERAWQQQCYAENEAKISRLQEAKQAIQQSKENVEACADVWKTISLNFEADQDWEGAHKNDILNCMSTAVETDYNTYISNIDAVLDAICDEITRLENENWKTMGIIGHLSALINSLWNENSKLFN